MTTSRMIVVLRSELGNQLSLAQKEKDNLREKYAEELDNYARGGKPTKGTKESSKAGAKCFRLETAIQALGSLQLGDIEDVEL